MAVQPQTPYKEYTANGSTKSFSLGFDCESQDHLIVRVDDIEPVAGTWSLSGGAVVFGTAPSNSKKITIQRNTPASRSTEYKSSDNSFRPGPINKDFDWIWLKLQELGVADWLMKLYIDRLHQHQEQKINDLKGYVDDRDDELRAYLLEEIRKQGVALDQLDKYYNYLMQRLAEIAVSGGWEASFVVDASGKNQQEINNNTAYFYKTVNEMLVDINLTDGVIVGTKGYHNLFDNGGAIYLISAAATDYSIPLANGLHAVFHDSFDIRKFGIVSNKTLDQTAALTRMVNYADSREYEIDFHNFEIMTPETYHFTTGRGAVIKGLGFKKPHYIKNLFIANDKTKNLFSGTCPIHFIPDDLTGYGLFKLSNVTFDPYNPNFTLASGEGDGMLFGFHAMWHPDAGGSWPADHQFVTGYELEFDNIHFASPAISYNLACAGFFTKSIKARNLTGEYWGIYLVNHTYSLDVDGIHGIFRNDLHTGSGRLLVTNLIHEEAEIGSGIITRNLISVKNASCYLKSNGSVHVVYKCHRIGTITINTFIAENYIGALEFYGGDTLELRAKLKILNFTAKNSPSVRTSLSCEVVNATFDNFDVCTSYVLNNNIFTNLTLNNIRRFDRAISITYAECQTLTIANCGEVLDDAYGLIRSDAKVKNIIISGITCNKVKFIECSFENMQISKLNTEITTSFNNYILNRPVAEFLPATVAIKDSKIYATGGALLNLSTGGIDTISSSHLVGNFHSYGSAPLSNTSVKKTVTYDPPSIPSGGSVSTTVSLQGVKLGDNISVAFTQYDANITVGAQVSSANTVTVVFRNIGVNAVDLPSGTLTIKLI